MSPPSVKPCRCGEIPVIRRLHWLDAEEFSIRCPSCHTTTPWLPTEPEAIARWNEMVEKPAP